MGSTMSVSLVFVFFSSGSREEGEEGKVDELTDATLFPFVPFLLDRHA